jgi:hypothetical protein
MIFVDANYMDWAKGMKRLRYEIVGKTHPEASRLILRFYGGAGSIMDMAVGDWDRYKERNLNFYKYRRKLYNWASRWE